MRRYLQAEIDHVKAATPPGGDVLELGCGYGRVLDAAAAAIRTAVGIDTSAESLSLGARHLEGAARRLTASSFVAVFPRALALRHDLLEDGEPSDRRGDAAARVGR